jgi:hypothetical protein
MLKNDDSMQVEMGRTEICLTDENVTPSHNCLLSNYAAD